MSQARCHRASGLLWFVGVEIEQAGPRLHIGTPSDYWVSQLNVLASPDKQLLHVGLPC